MAIDWDVTSVGDFNRRNHCCCPAPECGQPGFDVEHRDAGICKGGFSPFLKIPAIPAHDDVPEVPAVWPDAFDLSTTGELIPVYSTRTVSTQRTVSGSYSNTTQLYDSGGLIGQVSWASAVAIDVTRSLTSKYNEPIQEWPASNIPYEPCGANSTIVPAGAPSGLAISYDTPVDGTLVATLTWTENRPEVAEEKWGFYEILIDGSTYYSGEDPEFEFELEDDDTSCHWATVRHWTGLTNINGQWSDYLVFSRPENECCKEPEMACQAFSTGNTTASISAAEEAGQVTWTMTITGSAVTPSSDSGNLCSPWTGSDPSGLILPYYGDEGTVDGDPTHTRTASTDTVTQPFSDNTPNTASADTAYYSWQVSFQEWSITGSLVEKTEYSDNINTGSTAVSAIWTDLEGVITAFDDLYGWGITIPGTFLSEGDAGEIKHYYPVTNGTQTVQTSAVWVRVRQLRVRWIAPENHVGEKYRVQWDWAFFPDAWTTWRSEYFTWATEKYDYLNKPSPGDDDYPVLSDFDGAEDPSAALAAAIAAIDAIEDPGAAPDEPETGPTIVDSHEWVWENTQTEQPFEEAPACDPTAPDRQPPEEPEPLGPDPTPEEIAAHEAAQEAYDDAVAETARQSGWTIHTPVEPTTPTGVWRVANVRWICGDTPYGLIKNYDSRFPTTTLPPLDPTEWDPSLRGVWYS